LADLRQLKWFKTLLLQLNTHFIGKQQTGHSEQQQTTTKTLNENTEASIEGIHRLLFFLGRQQAVQRSKLNTVNETI
jgi:hypothetical protein